MSPPDAHYKREKWPAGYGLATNGAASPSRPSTFITLTDWSINRLSGAGRLLGPGVWPQRANGPGFPTAPGVPARADGRRLSATPQESRQHLVSIPLPRHEARQRCASGETRLSRCCRLSRLQ
jgi:hypothetical protein